MLGGEIKNGLGEDRQIAIRSEQIDGHFKSSRDHGSAGTWQPPSVEDVSCKRSKTTARWWQNPKFAGEFGKLDTTPSNPWVFRAGCDKIGVVVEDFETLSVFGKGTNFSQYQQV